MSALRNHRAWVPWLVRVAVCVVVLASSLTNEIQTYGLDRDGPWSLGRPMSLMILLMGAGTGAFFAVLEGFFAGRARRLWVECVMAAAGSAVITWWSTLAIELRFGGTDPVTQANVEMTVTSLLIMGVAYTLFVLACRAAIPRARRAIKGSTSPAASSFPGSVGP